MNIYICVAKGLPNKAALAFGYRRYKEGRKISRPFYAAPKPYLSVRGPGACQHHGAQ